MPANPSPMPRRRRLARAVRPLSCLAPLLLSACVPAVLGPEGSIAIQERTLLVDSMAIMLSIIVPTILLTLGFAWWFRASNTRAKYNPTWAYSGAVELIVWGVPLLTIMLLGGVAWVASHRLDPAVTIASKNKPIEVQVVSLDWKWLFIYPEEHIATVNTLTVPADTPIHFVLTSASVMNSFYVPQIGSQIYTMSGMSAQLNLIADHPGTYAGLSTHYSGDGFSDMYFNMHAVPASDYASWVAATKASGPVLDQAAYTELAKQSLKVAPYSYKDVTPDLYTDIVSLKVAPGPGPRPSDPASSGEHRIN